MENAVVSSRDIDIVNKFTLEHIAQPKDQFCEQPIDAILDSLVQNMPYLDWGDVAIERFLGRGSFTHVHKGRLRAADGTLCCAIKSLNPSKTKKKAALVDASNDLVNEVLILSHLGRHDNIIGLIGILPNVSITSGIILLLECLEETLAARLKKWRKQEKESDQLLVPRDTSRRIRNVFLRSRSSDESVAGLNHRIRQAALGIANGLKFLHQQDTIHRDLKPQNIGFETTTGTVKLFDFGMARKLPKESVQPNPTMGEVAGTWSYMAPETMKAHGSNYSSDVYSFGIVLSEICTLQSPFNKKDYRNWHHLKMSILEGERPSLDMIPKQRSTVLLRRCILQCWDDNADRRPHIEAICNDLEKHCRDAEK